MLSLGAERVGLAQFGVLGHGRQKWDSSCQSSGEHKNGVKRYLWLKDFDGSGMHQGLGDHPVPLRGGRRERERPPSKEPVLDPGGSSRARDARLRGTSHEWKTKQYL